MEVLDRGRWYTATVLRVDNERIQIHYNGWGSQHDEWISTDSERLRRKIK